MADEDEDNSTRKRYSAVALAKRDYEGRRPSYAFTAHGPVIRGFRSRPGATMSPRDAAQASRRLPAADPNTGRTDNDAWNQFFHSPSPVAPPRVAAPDPTAFQTAGGMFPQLAPESGGNADDMASFLSRPYAGQRANPGALYRAALQNHATALGVGTTLPNDAVAGSILPSHAVVTRKSGPFMSIATPYGSGSVRPAAVAARDPRSPKYMPKHEREWAALTEDYGV
jgi:hypothetical protein